MKLNHHAVVKISTALLGTLIKSAQLSGRSCIANGITQLNFRFYFHPRNKIPFLNDQEIK